MKLFSSPYFFELSEQEVKTFEGWIKRSGVKWGTRPAQREALLPGFQDQSSHGTWEEAFEMLLSQLIFLPERRSQWDLPYLEFSDSVLLGKAIFLIRSLEKDLESVMAFRGSGKEWADHLLKIFHRYLKASIEELAPLESKLLALKELSEAYSFQSMTRYLETHLHERGGVRHSRCLNAILFRSIKPGVLRQSEVIAFLGMQEGAFPRSPLASSLNLLEEGDYIPSPPDEDRYFFLEALSVAEKALWMFYQNMNEEDGKEQPPSALIQELEPELEVHPPFSFHASYFAKERIYSKREYEKAKAYYSEKKQEPFIPEFSSHIALPVAKGIEPIELEKLLRFARHPLRYYCNMTLNLYLHYEENHDPEFFISPLVKHRILVSGESLEEAEARGHLPLGRFRDVALQSLLEQQGEEEEKISLKEKVRNYPLTMKSEDEMRRYLEYYEIALQTPSPLHPECAEALLCKDAKAFAAKIKTLSDPYVDLLFRGAEPQVIYERWAPYLQTVFKSLLEPSN